jgi:hypothetical protein
MHFIRSFRRGVSGLLLVAALVACSRISLAAESPPPQGVQRSGESEVQFNEGLIDYQLGRMSSAEQHFGAVLTQAPDDFEAR